MRAFEGVVKFAFGIQTKAGEDGGRQVTGRHRVSIWIGTGLVAGTVTTADVGTSLLSQMASSMMTSGIAVTSGIGTGPTTMLSVGTASIIPDTRLNRLFVMGTAADIINIERHLQIIDRSSSIFDVQTYGKPRMIELKHTRAEDVASVVRDAYAGRILTTAQKSSQKKESTGQQPWTTESTTTTVTTDSQASGEFGQSSESTEYESRTQNDDRHR